MRVVFFGTPPVAATALLALLDSAHEIVGVVTQPARPKGRSSAPQPSAVATLAAQHDLLVLAPDTPKAEDFARDLAALRPDACAVVAYGHLLPSTVLAIPPQGFINAHFSLLPRFRGAAPVQHAIMAGHTSTGVCVFVLEPTLDTGPIIGREIVAIEPDDTSGTLLDRLAPIGAQALIAALDRIASGTATPMPQDDAQATPAPKIRTDQARIDWTLPATQIRNMIRGLNPVPGAFTLLRGKRIKIWESEVVPGSGAAGQVLDPEIFVVATGDGALRLTQIQPDGKRRMAPEEFTRGTRLDNSVLLGI